MNEFQWSSVASGLQRILHSPASERRLLAAQLSAGDPDVEAELVHLLGLDQDAVAHLDRLAARLRAGMADARRELDRPRPTSEPGAE